MPVTDQTTSNSSTGNGVTTVFAYTFKILAEADLLVEVDGVEQTLTTHYTVSGVGNSGGGNVTFVTAPVLDSIVVRSRDMAYSRETDYQENGDLLAATLDADVDRTTMLVQQVRQLIRRAVKLPAGVTTDQVLPSGNTVAERASKIIGFDAAGAPALLAAVDVSLTTVTAFIATLLDDADAATARATLGLNHAPCVNMIRSANSTNDTLTSAAWKVYDETGSEISTAGTTTDGLQEAINYAARYGYDLRVWGGGLKPAYWGVPYGGALGNNPFATTNGSNVVVVTHATHGRVTGDKMTFDGMTALVNNIPAANFAVELPITYINANSYSVTVATNANATSSAGGAACRWQDSGQDVAIINCSTGIVVPPLQGVNWEVHATINFGGAGGTAAIAFDSIMASEIKITDQIVCASGYPIGVEFKPTKELPQDPNGPVVTSCRIYLPSIVMLAAAGACVSLDCTNGDIADAVFDIIEPNGGAYGVRSVFAASHGVRSNKIRINGAHDQTSAMVSVGQSATGATNSYGNQWEIQGHPAAGAVGVDIWGVNDHFVIDADAARGSPAVGVKFESSAAGNVVVGHRVEGTLVLQDVSTDRSNTFVGARVAASVHRNNVDQTAIATATWTKVQFTTEVFDAGGKFDSATNYRWTPGRVGMALITANVAWVTAVDATLAGIAIYKNGAVHHEEYTYMSGTGGSQGPSITALVLVDAQTDYFEIFVRQDSGGNRDIAGSTSDTFAMFLMQP